MSEGMAESERIASYVLARLYENGLTPLDIKERDLTALCKKGDPDSDLDKERTRRVKAVNGVMDYLVNENIIRVRGGYYEFGIRLISYVDVSLTSHGLRILHALPKGLDPDTDQRTFGERMADSVEGGNFSIAAQVFREMLSRFESVK